MNELQLLPNPDNIPGAVSSGYQRQNTNLFVLQTGLDTTEPYDDENETITIPEGGIVEINGSLFKLTSEVSLTKEDAATAYWIAVSDNGDGTAGLSLVTRPGVLNPAKRGCYTSSGARTLNWVSFGTPVNLTETALYTRTTKGTDTLTLRKGWYYVELASGLGGGNGGEGQIPTGAMADSYSYVGGLGGGGGVASLCNIIKKLLFIEEPSKGITVKIGGSGWNGGMGGKGGDGSQPGVGGGGGGSGFGEESAIVELSLNTMELLGGEGGKGCDYGAGGGAGGGGAGIIGGPGGINSYSSSYNGSNGESIRIGIGLELYGGTGGKGGNSYASSSGGTGGVGGKSSNGSNGAAGIKTQSGQQFFGTGGGGGGMGAHGRGRADGSPGGYCNIYKMEDAA